MTRGTTPNLIFTLCDDVLLSEAEKIIVTFSQNGEVLFNKEADIASDVNAQKLTIRLSQEDTLLMSGGSYVQFQVRLLINGQVFATPIYKSIVYDTLSDEVLVGGETSTASTDEVIDGDSIKPCYATASCEYNEICATVGDVMRSGGKDGKDGKDGIANLTPSYPVPIVGDIVVFSTSDNVYIGLVKEAQSAGLTVTAKLKIENSGL